MPPTDTDEGLRAAVTIRLSTSTSRSSCCRPTSPRPTSLTCSTPTAATTHAGIAYLLKDRVGHVRDFLDSIDRVAAGGTVVHPDVVRHPLARRRNDGLVALTERERDAVLALDG